MYYTSFKAGICMQDLHFIMLSCNFILYGQITVQKESCGITPMVQTEQTQWHIGLEHRALFSAKVFLNIKVVLPGGSTSGLPQVIFLV